MSDYTSIEEVELRIDTTIEYIESKTRLEKVKNLLKHAYKYGDFYSLPPKLLDKERDESFIIGLLLDFISTPVDGRAIPDGFENLLLPEAYEYVFGEGLVMGSRDYDISCGYIPKRVLENLGESANEIKRIEFEKINPEQIDEILSKFENGESIFLLDKKFNNPNIVNMLIERFFEKNSNATEKEIVDFYMKVLGTVYEKVAKETANIYNDYINNDVESMIKYSIYRYDEKNIVSFDTEKKDEAIRDFEEQRLLLIAILKNLSKVGALDELVDSENNSIDQVNVIFSDENKIEHVTKESIFNRVMALDLSSKDDVLELFVLSRHYANKLAHNYDNYMWTTLFLNTVSDKEFVEIKNKKRIDKEVLREGRYTELEDLFDKMWQDKEAYDTFVQIMKSYGKSEKFVKNMFNPRNQNAKTLLKNIVYSSIKDDEIQKYNSRIEYTKDIFDKIEDIRRVYYRAHKEIVRNNIEPPNFVEFLRACYEHEFFQLQYSHLTFTRDKKEVKVIDELMNLKSKIEKDGVLLNSKEVLMNLAQKLEMRENVFDVKHFFTMSLYHESICEDTEIRMENTPAKIVYVQKDGKELEKEETGVVDVCKTGYMQVFGGHYKFNDFETTSDEIQSLDGTHPDVSKSFLVKDVSKSLRTFVVLPKLTPAQMKECQKVSEVFLCVTRGQSPNPEMDMDMYARIKRMKEDDGDLYRTLEIKTALGAGINVYKNRFQVSQVVVDEKKTTEEELKVAMAIQEVLGNGYELNTMISSNMVKIDARVIDFINRLAGQEEVSYEDASIESKRVNDRLNESEQLKNNEDK